MTTALIYASSLAGFQKAYTNWNTAGQDGYQSVAFTGDGYIITHGKILKQFVLDSEGKVPKGSVTVDADGLLTVNIGGSAATFSNLVSAAADSGLEVTPSTEGYALKHKAFATTTNDTTVTPASISSYQLTPYTLKFDKTYGHYTTSAAGDAVHLDYVAQTLTTASTGSYYLLGSTSNVATTGATVKNTSVKVDISASTGAATLVAPKLQITGGASGITLGETGAAKTLDKYIQDAVDEAKTQAVSYKGTITPQSTAAAATAPAENPSNGDMYKITSDGYIITKGSGASATKTLVKSGDTIICKEQADKTVIWEVIPSGDEQETFIKYDDNGAAESGTFVFKGSGVAYNNKVYTFTNTEYSDFVGFGDSGKTAAAGLVPAPNKATAFLKSNGTWADLTSADITDLGTATHTIAIGSPTSNKSLTGTFGANASSDVTTYIPLATHGNTGDAVWGAVIGNKTATAPTASGWHEAQIIDGVVKFYDHLYSFSNLTISGTAGTAGIKTTGATDNGLKIEFDSQAAKALKFGANLTVAVNNGTLTVEGTPNTWRAVYAYSIEAKDGTPNSASNNGVRLESTSNSALQFGSEFVFTEADNTGATGVAEIHLAWAEVNDNGQITYKV